MFIQAAFASTIYLLTSVLIFFNSETTFGASFN
jgi:hypothetical protein